jgi:hypothetical protein
MIVGEKIVKMKIKEYRSNNRHFLYLKYLVKHKWYVLLASYKIKSSIWLALIHDWSKFKPSEWFPYVNRFFKSDKVSKAIEYKEFSVAWNAHQKKNKHHWQYWVLIQDNGAEILLEMPKKYMLEMVTDWMGAGKAITGNWDNIHSWYEKNKREIRFHYSTRLMVEELLKSLKG